MELNQISPSSLREHLFDILDSDTYVAIGDLPYAEQLALAKWHASEQARLEGWRSTAQPHENVMWDLSHILNAHSPSRKDAEQWLAQHRDKISVDMLMELVSSTRIFAVSDMAAERGGTKRKTTNYALAKVATRWLQLESEGKNKSEAAEIIAVEISRAVGTVYNYLTDEKYAERMYPDGIEVARRSLGLHAK